MTDFVANQYVKALWKGKGKPYDAIILSVRIPSPSSFVPLQLVFLVWWRDCFPSFAFGRILFSGFFSQWTMLPYSSYR